MNRAPNSAVTPIAEGGSGRYTWDRSHVLTNTYHVRHGSRKVARLMLVETVSDHASVLTALCQVLDQHEGEHE